MNIGEAGEVCQNIYEADWKPTMKIKSLFEVIKSMLINPDPSNALRPEIAAVFNEDREGWTTKAKQWTQMHAK